MRKKMYISGPITGLSRKEVKEAFDKASEVAISLNYIPINPMKLVPDHIAELDIESAWILAMKICVAAQMECDATLFLYDHEKSRGARIEHKIAEELHHTCYYLNHANEKLSFKKTYENALESI